MNKIFNALLLMAISLPLLNSCGGNDNDSNDDSGIGAKNLERQEKEYNQLINTLPGRWVLCQRYESGHGYDGWLKVEKDQSGYRFTSDGKYTTFYYDGSVGENGTYRLEKNPMSLKVGKCCRVLLCLKPNYSKYIESENMIWFDEEGFLRISGLGPLGSTWIEEDSKQEGEGCFRYQKE